MGESALLARRCATASAQGMLSRTTSARPRNSGAGRAAPTPRQATATTAQVRASGRYSPRSRCQARRLAATSIVAHSTTAAPAHNTHAVAAGVRLSWAWSMRLTIAAPIAAMAAVSGRWLSIHCRLADRSGLGSPVAGEVEVGPPGAEADHDGDQPDGEGERADRLARQSGDDTGERFAEHDDGQQPEPF